MGEDTVVATPSGIGIPPEGPATAEALQQLVREATRDLAFGVEPAAFLAALERLAPDEGDGR